MNRINQWIEDHQILYAVMVIFGVTALAGFLKNIA